MKDKAGREIMVDDIIIYGHKIGRSAGLKYGKVCGNSARGLAVWGYGNSQAGYLQYEDRILVVNRDQVPQKTLEALDKY